METVRKRKIAEDFHCKYCNYKCSKLSDWKKHCLTAKHKRKLLETPMETENSPLMFSCECGKKYSSKSGLWKHKNKCKIAEKSPKMPETDYAVKEEIIEQEKEESEEEIDYDSMTKEELKLYAMLKNEQHKVTTLENKLELKTLENSKNEEIIGMQKGHINEYKEVLPLIGNTANITNNTNNTNNFNLNFFLNDTCKDAMNITDFIESLQVQLKELEYTTDNGHVKGITNIFHTALSNMAVEKRPLHCTDLKREVLYIKDNDEWKRDEDKGQIKSAVTKVVDKNLSNSEEWLDKYPNVLTPGSKDSNRYIKMSENSLGTGDESEQNKIIKNILKEVVIDKEK